MNMNILFVKKLAEIQKTNTGPNDLLENNNTGNQGYRNTGIQGRSELLFDYSNDFFKKKYIYSSQ